MNTLEENIEWLRRERARYFIRGIWAGTIGTVLVWILVQP